MTFLNWVEKSETRKAGFPFVFSLKPIDKIKNILP